MKAKPFVYVDGEVVECAPDKATHIELNMPCECKTLRLPVIIKGTREGTGCWSWNGSVDNPTIKPSVLTTGWNFRCHCWINDGIVKFLDDTYWIKAPHADNLDADYVKPNHENFAGKSISLNLIK